MNIFQLEERINENPDSPLATRLAGQYLIRGKIREAVQLSLKCIEQNPDYATTYIILGRCYAALQKFDEALLCANKALSIQPDSSIIKNLTANWERSSIQAIVNNIDNSVSELPDINQLKQILFKEFYELVSSTKEEHSPGKDELVSENVEFNDLSQKSDTSVDLPEIENIQTQIPNEVDKEFSLINTNAEEQLPVVEFVEEGKMNVSPIIESAIKSIDLNNQQTIEDITRIDTEDLEKEVEVKEEKEAFFPDEGESEKHEITTSETLSSVSKEELPGSISEISTHEVSEINNLDISKEVGYELSSEISETQGDGEANIIDEVKLEKEVISSQIGETEKLIDFEDSISDKSEQQSVIDVKQGTEPISKSDEHIAKIFESAHETTKKESVSEQSDFNHGPVPELPQIVSATLAEIYVRQGEYEEAIKTYKALIQLRPKQREIFEKKIEELEKKLKSLM